MIQPTVLKRAEQRCEIDRRYAKRKFRKPIKTAVMGRVTSSNYCAGSFRNIRIERFPFVITIGIGKRNEDSFGWPLVGEFVYVTGFMRDNKFITDGSWRFLGKDLDDYKSRAFKDEGSLNTEEDPNPER